tara:strand:- start:1303 stop:2673 length:1371 start_codon:yes stop_codon:yes gene_type:complete
MPHIPGHNFPTPAYGFGYGNPVQRALDAGRIPMDTSTSISFSDLMSGIKAHPLSWALPVAGTAMHWNEMGPWERGLSLGADVADIASLGTLRPLTGALGASRLARDVPNPLTALRKLPNWDQDQYFIRSGRPRGSGIESLYPSYPSRPQSVFGQLGNYPVAPPTYKDLPIKPQPEMLPSNAVARFKQTEPMVSKNWGSPGGYAWEKGQSSYMATPFDPTKVPRSTGAFDVAEEVPSVYGNSGVSLQHTLTKPSGQAFTAEELANPNLMVLRNPQEYIYSLGRDTLTGDPHVKTRSPWIEHGISGLDPQELQRRWLKEGLPDALTGPVGKGTYRIEGRAVPELGADMEHLMDYAPTAKQLQRINYDDLAVASPSYSAQIFGHLDPYGRRLIPGGEVLTNPLGKILREEADWLRNTFPPFAERPTVTMSAAETMRMINAYMANRNRPDLSFSGFNEPS